MDLRELPPDGTKRISEDLRKRASFAREVVEAATSARVGERWLSAAGCIAEEPRYCGAYVRVELDVPGRRVLWECCCCEAAGVITEFEGSESDFRRYIPQGRVVLWGFDEFQYALLRNGARRSPALRAVISRAMPLDEEREEPLVLHATIEELDSIYTLVEELLSSPRFAGHLDPLVDLDALDDLESLDDLRASLCTAMDGF